MSQLVSSDCDGSNRHLLKQIWKACDFACESEQYQSFQSQSARELHELETLKALIDDHKPEFYTILCSEIVQEKQRSFAASLRICVYALDLFKRVNIVRSESANILCFFLDTDA
jgi:hypothetical protein